MVHSVSSALSLPSQAFSGSGLKGCGGGFCLEKAAAHPGFSADPYRDYSQPWFGSHKVLRGACFATRSRMRSAK